MSEATKEALKGAYETEPGHGGERDAYLDKTGVTTYLIVEKVCVILSPFLFLVEQLALSLLF